MKYLSTIALVVGLLTFFIGLGVELNYQTIPPPPVIKFVVAKPKPKTVTRHLAVKPQPIIAGPAMGFEPSERASEALPEVGDLPALDPEPEPPQGITKQEVF
jgi:hypothetical protein